MSIPNSLEVVEGLIQDLERPIKIQEKKDKESYLVTILVAIILVVFIVIINLI